MAGGGAAERWVSRRRGRVRDPRVGSVRYLDSMSWSAMNKWTRRSESTTTPVRASWKPHHVVEPYILLVCARCKTSPGIVRAIRSRESRVVIPRGISGSRKTFVNDKGPFGAKPDFSCPLDRNSASPPTNCKKMTIGVDNVPI